AYPCRFLDDTTVHIDDVEAAIGPCIGIYRTEIHIPGSDELILIIYIPVPKVAVLPVNLCAPDQPADRFANQVIALHPGGGPGAPANRLAAGGCKADQRAVCPQAVVCVGCFY